MVTRRFVNSLLGTGIGALLASIFYPVVRFLSPPEVPEPTTNRVEAGPTNDPQLVQRGFKILRFGNEPVILIRVAADDYRAFSATCTHLQCIVEYQQDKTRIWCNCHNGEYNLRGVPVAGPPPRPLTPYKVDLVSRGGGPEQTIVVSRA
jgi:cytochrome b6-f complex iron-sulfur subunit